MGGWKDVAELAQRQHGLVARRQLLALGIARSTIPEHAKRHGWDRPRRGVYRLPGTAASFEQDVLAALLAVGEDALASHLTAAYLHGVLSLRPPVVDILLPYRQRAPKLLDVHVTRSRTLRTADRCIVGGIPTTTLPRTMIDAATVLEPPGIRSLLIDARQRRRLDLSRVARRLLDVGPVRNSGELRRIIEELAPGRVDSVLEEAVRRLLGKARLSPPHPAPFPVQIGARRVELDIAWPDRKVGIEVDGYGSHADRRAMDLDHRKQNAVVLQGWQLLRVGWDRIAQDPDGFAAEVAALLSEPM